MSDPVVANIIKSGAVLWYAAVGTAIPDETTVAFGAAWSGVWARVGYTKEPLALAYESEEMDITVDEVLAPVARRRTGEGATLETVLAELTAAYLQLAASDQDDVTETAAASEQKAYEETGLGGQPVLQEYAWGFEGMYIISDGTLEPIRVFVHKGTAMLNGPLEFSKKSDDYTGVSIQIKALADTTQDQGQELLLFQRMTAEASGE